MKAFIFEPLWDELITLELLTSLKRAGVEYVVIKEVAPLRDHTPLYEGDEPRIIYINPDYVGWKLTEHDYKDIPNLKGIFGAATSFSWIEMGYATEHGIPISNIKGFSAEAVAEYAVMVMLNLARQVPRLVRDGFPLDYDKDFMKYRGIELHGKTAGIVGLGRIGNLIAKRCKGLGMNVVYWSEHSRSDEYQYLELEEAVSNSDVLFPIMATNDVSSKLIKPELLEKMRTSAIIVDMSHELFDHAAAIDMVNDGRLFGLGFEGKPGTFNDYEGNIWAAPEYAWVTDNSMRASVRMQIENMIAALEGKFPNKVN